MRAGSTATSSSSGALGDTHPFTTKKGSSMDMASRPPAASRLLRAQRAQRTSLCPTHPPRAAAGASAWGTRSLCARRPGCTGPPRVQHFVGTADRIPDSGAPPRGRPLPRLLPARPAAWLRPRVAQPPPVMNAVCRPTSAPMLT